MKYHSRSGLREVFMYHIWCGNIEVFVKYYLAADLSAMPIETSSLNLAVGFGLRFSLCCTYNPNAEVFIVSSSR